MKFDVENGNYVGTMEWAGPGEVRLDMDDEKHRRFFESYFSQEDSSMNGPVDNAWMTSERRDESEAAFTRAAYQLAAHAYKVRARSGSTHSR